MATYDNAYSQFVAGAKVLLPLIAVALLSTLFLWARGPAEPSDLTYQGIEDIAREPRVTAPAYAGIARNGAVVSLRADEIRPQGREGGAGTATALRATMDMADGRRIEMRADAGTFDDAARRAALTGLARVVTSDGFEMETSGLEADLAAGEIRSTGPLEVQAPFGALTAARMSAGTDGGPLLFSGGVRLVYTPDPAVPEDE
ncbi:hypothetical protein [Wenxinia saemankumensis]|uniref:Lipopolysaccharide export system protein LptC n=1 Tax=Wenxinia saemankumensis TaxID=1447782 RepID=A0A1M6FS29_9RHOB|nr:hypothetical protein [Wenxinia saemankumensis]SHJ00494.1 lipopolysaccharide export system protein LptC [Wenxinia saemankumensis]